MTSRSPLSRFAPSDAPLRAAADGHPDPVVALQSSLARTESAVRAACADLETLRQAQGVVEDGEGLVQAYERRARAIATAAHATAFAELMTVAAPLVQDTLAKIQVQVPVPARRFIVRRPNPEVCRLVAVAEHPDPGGHVRELRESSSWAGHCTVGRPECLVLRPNGTLAWFVAEEEIDVDLYRALGVSRQEATTWFGGRITTAPLLDGGFLTSRARHRSQPVYELTPRTPLVWPEEWAADVAMRFDILTQHAERTLKRRSSEATKKANEIQAKRARYGL